MEDNVQKITMNTEECSKYIGRSYWTILNMAKKRTIPHIKMGREYFYRKETIDKWMEKQEEKSVVNENNKIENKPYFSRKKYV